MDVPKDKKKRTNSKSKGNGFESQVAKLLTQHLQPLNFIRTQGSGARVGGKNFDTIGKLFGADALKLFVGDVVPTNEKDTNLRFNFSIETKFYKTPDNFTSLVTGSANFFKWFNEAETDAAKVGKMAMLIFKWNHTPTFAAVLTTVGLRPTPPNISISYTFEGQRLMVDVFELNTLLKFPYFWYDKAYTGPPLEPVPAFDIKVPE
jgi:hypothetical protein